jgi:hypothetical protein
MSLYDSLDTECHGVEWEVQATNMILEFCARWKKTSGAFMGHISPTNFVGNTLTLQ